MDDFSADVKLAQEGSSEAFSRLYTWFIKICTILLFIV